MRPIKSVIAIVLLKLEEIITKLLTPFLGRINQSNIKHPGKIVEILRGINIKYKLMASLDVKSKYNVPTNIC